MAKQTEVGRFLGRVRVPACLLSLAIGVSLTSLSPAEESTTRGGDQVQASDDAQNLLFFGPLRPIWIRLRVTIDGKPFRESWQANIKKLFADADTDGDGLIRAAAKAEGEQQKSSDNIASLATTAA